MNFGFNPAPPEKKGVTYTNYENPNGQACVIDNWCKAKEEYDIAKSKLDENKRHLIEVLNNDIRVGTSHLNSSNFSISVSVSEQYKVNSDDLQSLNMVLSEIANVCGCDVANSVIMWKPSLNKKIYDNLPDELKCKLNQFISMSYSNPTVTLSKG